jgi:hypothetical protein
MVIGGLLVVASGCSTKGTAGAKSASVAVSAAGTAASAQGTGSSAAIDGGNGVSIDRVRLVVREVELEAPEGAVCPSTSSGSGDGATDTGSGTGSGSSTGTGSGSGMAASTGSGSGSDSSGTGIDGKGSDGDCEFGGGPFLVDLSGSGLDSGIHWVAAIEAPAGTYEESKIVINTLPAALAGADAGLAEMAAANASIIVDGTLNATPFTFATPIEVQQKREGAITIDPATSTNLTLDVDPSGWFKAADGSLLSPTDPTATGAILANIRASIRIVHDNNRDGKDDEHPTP